MQLGESEPGFARVEHRHTVADLLARLPDRDRRIIELRFIREMTQAEIADEVGVSQMHVSRLLAQALTKLRALASAS